MSFAIHMTQSYYFRDFIGIIFPISENWEQDMYSKILATGSYMPAQIRTNADLEKMVDTSDEWIVTRSGMKERRIAAADETVATMGFAAAK